MAKRGWDRGPVEGYCWNITHMKERLFTQDTAEYLVKKYGTIDSREIKTSKGEDPGNEVAPRAGESEAQEDNSQTIYSAEGQETKTSKVIVDNTKKG